MKNKNRNKRKSGPSPSNYDFAGYVTRNNIQCSDGRIISPNAFEHQDGSTVPLVWQHDYTSPENVIGNIFLQNKSDGVYGFGLFNSTQPAKHAGELVEHGDVVSLSIAANQLKQQQNYVQHGLIREVSLVLAGANPGAYIENVALQHGDGTPYIDEEAAIMYMNGRIKTRNELQHEDEEYNEDIKGEEDEESIWDTMDEEQQMFVAQMVGEIMDEYDIDEDDEDDYEDDEDDYEENEGMEHTALGGNNYMRRNNVFEQNGAVNTYDALVHADLQTQVFNTIVADAISSNNKFGANLQHAEDYGIENIGLLFPDYKNIEDTPGWIKRDTGWVGTFFGALNKRPFSNIKSMFADITADEARAKGYVTGAEKEEEIFKLLQRRTSATTIYKKQKLDRDDILEITSFDVVTWMKAEMRLMLDEEIARAILIGDGRPYNDKDKINEEHIRPIVSDVDFYTHKHTVETGLTAAEFVDDVLMATKYHKGTGKATMYTTKELISKLLVSRDTVGHRLYKTTAELATAMGVSEIVEVEVMEGHQTKDDETVYDTKAILVNPTDYTVGTNRGGEINFFSDFDIDFNQEKYLYETRMSGALTKPKAAIVIRSLATETGTNVTKNTDKGANTDKPFGAPMTTLPGE